VTGRRIAQGAAGAALLISALTLLSRLAGFGRTLVFTNAVGADSTGDTYQAANNVPNIVFEVVAGGALAGLVVPMLAGGIAAGDREQVRRTASALLGWTLLVLVPLAALLAALARPIAAGLLGGDADDPAKVDLAARFLLVFSPQVVLYGLAVVLTGVLQAHRRFAGPALAPLLSSLLVAAAYLLFAGVGGSRAVADLSTPAELVLGVGTTLGVLALTVSLLPPLRGLRLGLRPSLRFPVGAAPRVVRLAVAGVLTLAGQQLVAVVAIRLANAGAPDGTQVVYFAGMTVFLLPWAALAVPVATSVYPGLSERAERGDEAGYAATLAPAAVLTVVAGVVAAAGLVAVSGPLARVFLASDPGSAAALQPTIAAFAPGLPGYALVALLSRALYARGLWRAPTGCVAGGWLVAVAADLVLAAVLPAADRAVALGSGHSLGVTVAGIALLAVVARQSGAAALSGVARTALPALLAGALAGTAGLLTARALGADPVPTGSVPTAIGIGVAAGGVVLAVVAAVLLSTSRRALRTAVSGLRRSSGGSDDGPGGREDGGSGGGPSRGSSSASSGAEVAGV
jgi:putative peptidoglycan lipid II flippase